MRLSILLDMAAEGYGDRVALCRDGQTTTFAQLAQRAAIGADVIRAHSGRHVVLLSRNGPVMPHLMFAAVLAGVPFTPMNYRLDPGTIRSLIRELDQPLVIAEADYAPLLDDEWPVVTVDSFVGWTDSSASVGSAELSAPDDDTTTAVMLFTSGTTAKPKIVRLRHKHLASYILSTVEFGSADVGDAALVTVPPYHVAAVGAVLSNLYAGRRVVYLADFDAATWLALIAQERITSAMVVPTMLSRIVDHLDGKAAAVSDLKLISYGGARMPRTVLEKAMAAFPAAGFVNAYGLTETSSTITLLGPEDHRAALNADDERVRARLGSAGRPVPGVELQIRREDGRAAGPNEPGELWVRGAQVSGEYADVGSVLDADGWFATKDLASIDDDGYLFIAGRADDMIIRGGENIAPAEIEDVLRDHPGIVDAAVVGVPDDEWGERLVAVVVPRAGAEIESDSLRGWLRQRVRGSRTPDRVVSRDALPYTATGKLLRRELMASLRDARGER